MTFITRHKNLLSFLLIFIFLAPIKSQNLSGGGEANPDLHTNQSALKKWQDFRFGMFIHWGPVTLRGTEIGWSRGREIPAEEYDQLYKEFNPVKFSAKDWISLLKKAGMKYLVIVTKHHDGFVMWDSKTTDYDIMSTPYGKDVIKELSEECRKQGILFGTYYSICDWHHPDYPEEQNHPGGKEDPDLARYISYMKMQLKELIMQYHSRIIWFDGEWEKSWTHELGMELYRYVRSLDDKILINNRVDKGRKGMEGTNVSDRFAGDFATPEQQIGKYDTLTPWESCITICKQWAWKPDDRMKSLDECISTLVNTAGGGGNLLLNIGPTPQGNIEERQSRRLLQVGRWLSAHGPSIYGTMAGPLPPEDWGVSTQKGNKVFLHVLNYKKKLQISNFPYTIQNAVIFNHSEMINFEQNGRTVTLTLPDIPENQMDTIIELTCN